MLPKDRRIKVNIDGFKKKKRQKKRKKKKSITLDTTGNGFYSVQNLYLMMEYMLLLNLDYSKSLENLDIQFLFLLWTLAIFLRRFIKKSIWNDSYEVNLCISKHDRDFKDSQSVNDNIVWQRIYRSKQNWNNLLSYFWFVHTCYLCKLNGLLNEACDLSWELYFDNCLKMLKMRM